MRPTRALIVALAALACLLAVAMAAPQGYKPEPKGKVKIQTYRGPNKEKVGYEYFAPWGFYVTQPEDDKPKYH